MYKAESYTSPYQEFILESYSFETDTGLATFIYSFDGALIFTEKINMPAGELTSALDTALFYAFVTLGVSYYKAFPTKVLTLKQGSLSVAEADHFNSLYLNGLGEFLYRNNLAVDTIGKFKVNGGRNAEPVQLNNGGVMLMQSGGKDSILASTLLAQKGTQYSSWYLSSSETSPAVIGKLGHDALITTRRTIDKERLNDAATNGGLNGHVPLSAILASIATCIALLTGKKYIMAANEWSAIEPTAMIGDFPINHQYSKTYEFETSFNKIIQEHISKDLVYLSALRHYSELKVAELFAECCWKKYSLDFSSCNVANYYQGADNAQLKWCGQCAKCVSTFILLAPYVEFDDLVSRFGRNVLLDPGMLNHLKSLFGLTESKPFECVGEVNEMRKAYTMAVNKDERYRNPDIKFDESEFDETVIHDHNPELDQLIDL